MRRIVVNGRFLAQPPTGVQRYAIETLRALDGLIGREPRLLRGTRWQLALPHDARDPPLLDHFEFRTLQFLRGHAWEQVSLAAFARGAYLVNAGYSGPVLKRRQMITVHDAAVRALPGAYSLRYRLLHDALLALLAPRVDTLATVSRFSARELRSRYGIARDDLLLCRNGAEHAQRPPEGGDIDDAEVLARHGLTARGYLLAVGSPKASKNFGVIPQALALVGGAELPLAVVGIADDRVYRGGRQGHAPLMRPLGAVPDDELYALYRHAAWFVFPSLYEGFGLPALEAMACGCPVLAADAASIPEVCGDAALYFDPRRPESLAERLREVLNDPEPDVLRARLAQRAQARLALYRWDVNARIVLDRLVATGALGEAGETGAALLGSAS